MKRYFTWEETRAQLKEKGLIDEELVEKYTEELRERQRAYQLAEMREMALLSQEQVAERIGVSQSRISRMENGELDRAQVSTLRDYVRALGGDIEVVARLGDKRFVIG